jgi:hypothetical protein
MNRCFKVLLGLLLLACPVLAQDPASNYSAQGGKSWVVGGTLNIQSGGALQIAGAPVTASAAELNSGADAVGNSATFEAAAGAANVSEITITVKDGAGATVAAVHMVEIWLSDSATCAGLTGTTASGAVAAKAASGVDIDVHVAKKAMLIQTLATGIYVLSITDTAKSLVFVCAAAPGTGKAVASAQLTALNYG